eukprot:SAG22_NODE_560_length_9102_cov_54.310785_9_plen_236_part_00
MTRSPGTCAGDCARGPKTGTYAATAARRWTCSMPSMRSATRRCTWSATACPGTRSSRCAGPGGGSCCSRRWAAATAPQRPRGWPRAADRDGRLVQPGPPAAGWAAGFTGGNMDCACQMRDELRYNASSGGQCGASGCSWDGLTGPSGEPPMASRGIHEHTRVALRCMDTHTHGRTRWPVLAGHVQIAQSCVPPVCCGTPQHGSLSSFFSIRYNIDARRRLADGADFTGGNMDCAS